MPGLLGVSPITRPPSSTPVCNPSPFMMSSSAGTLGIDFGTSNSAMAWLGPEGRARLIPLEGEALATLVVMCILRPRTQSEWIVGVISTVVASISGGAAVIQQYELHHWANNPVGLVAMLGLAFACGLPGWAVVRWAFNFFDKRRKADLLEVMTELREGAIGGKTE